MAFSVKDYIKENKPKVETKTKSFSVKDYIKSDTPSMEETTSNSFSVKDYTKGTSGSTQTPTQQLKTTFESRYSPALGYDVGRQISEFESNKQQRKQEKEETKQYTEQYKAEKSSALKDVEKQLEELTGTSNSIGQYIQRPKLTQAEQNKFNALKIRENELKRVQKSKSMGFFEGYTPVDVEGMIKKTAEKQQEVLDTDINMYEGEGLQETSGYQGARAAGQMAKYGSAYALGGGGIERGVSKLIPSLAGTGVKATIGKEFAKDVILGQPLAFQEGWQQGLRGTELATYMGEQAIIDMFMNGVMVGGGKLVNNLKVAGDMEITKLAKQLSVQYSLPEESVYRAMKSITSNDRELAKQFNEDGILKPQFLDNVYQQSQLAAKQADTQVKGFKPGVNIEEPTPRSIRNVAQIDRLDTKLRALDAGLESKELEQLVVKQNALKEGLNDADAGTKAYQRTLNQIDELDTQIKQKINEVDKLTEDMTNLTKQEQGMTIEALQQKRSDVKKAFGKAIREFENDTLAYVQKVERQSTTAQPKFKKAVQEILAPIDTIAKSMNTPTQIRIEGMEDYLVKQGVTSGDDVLKLSASKDFIETLKKEYKVETPYEIEQAFKRLDGKKISDMSVDDLSDLQDTLQYIIHKQETGERFINSKRLNDVAEVIDEVKFNHFEDPTDIINDMSLIQEITNMESAIPSKNNFIINSISKTFRGDLKRAAGIVDELSSYVSSAATGRPVRALRPETIFKEISNFNKESKVYKLFEDLVDGNRNRYGRLQKSFNFLDSIKNKFEGINLKEKATISFKVGSVEQSVDLTKGQRMNIYLHSKNADNIAHLRDGGFTIRQGKFRKFKKPIKLDEKSFNVIIDSLSESDKAYADELFNYVNTTFKHTINNTSLMADGVTKANIDNYWTIMTDADFKSGGISYIKQGRTFETSKMLLERLDVKSASNVPLRIMDIDEVFMSQARMVANYENLALPIRNAKIVFENANVTKALRNIYGDNADDVMRNFIQDLEESRIVDKNQFDKATDKIIRGVRQAILGANPKVILNQVASLPNSMAEVDPQYFIGVNPFKISNELLESHSPELWWRNKGYVTREVGEITAESGDSLWTAGIRKSDNMTIRTIWGAVENETLATTQLQKGTKEFYEHVARRTEEVIHRTQPNWDALYRSDIARTKSMPEKLFTMFTTQRNQNFNMMYEGYREYMATGEISKLARPLSSVIMGSMMIGGIDYGAQKVLGRETEENYFANATVNSFISNSYIGSIIVQNIIQDYDVNNVLESSVTPVFKAFKDLPNIMERPGQVVSNSIKAIGTIVGVPAKNIEKWFLPIVKTMNEEAYIDYQMNLGNYRRQDLYSDFFQEFSKPNEDRDIDSLQLYIEKLVEDGATPDGLESSVKGKIDESGLYFNASMERALNFYIDKMERMKKNKN